MTRRDAIREYKQTFQNYPLAVREDKVRVRCGFVQFIDELARAGRITERQAQTWDGILQPKGKESQP